MKSKILSALLALLFPIAAQGATSIPITVEQALPYGVAGTAFPAGEPVTMGVPFASTDTFTLAASIKMTGVSDYQVAKMEQYPDTCISWARVSFIPTTSSREPLTIC